MNLHTATSLLSFGITEAYILIFLIMIIEGPIITMSAAFAASSGYLNIWIIFLLSFFADLVGDSLNYAIGYYGRKNLIEKYNHLFKIKTSILKRIEKHYKKHLGKTLFLVKMTPLAIPGLMLAGAGRVPLKRYVKWCAVIILPRTIFFTGVGYFFGVLINSVLRYYRATEYFLLGIIILIVMAYFLIKKASGRIYKRI